MTLTKPGLLAAGDLPLHPTLLHPVTGAPLRALGRRRDGRLIWPVIGGDGTDPAPKDPAGQENKPNDGPTDLPKPTDAEQDKPLRPAGEKALREEREARKALEKQLAELAPLAALKPIADLLGTKPSGDGKTDLETLTERLAAQEEAIVAERVARWRAEVQADKKLSAAQAAWLVGSSKEELAKAADDLIAAFGGPKGDDPPPRRSGMRPDPAQGARPGEKTSSIDGGRSLYADRHKRKTTTTT